MKAMILAAGLGTRLLPLTSNRPKALVEVAGQTMLEITLSRLRFFGVNEVIVNAHHFAPMIVEYLKAKENFGMRIEVSHEEQLLDTGGGLKKAAHFFLDSNGGSQEPFILHNVDVISSIDLKRMVQVHIENAALATLAVQDRESSRYLLFDEQNQLCGRQTALAEKAEGAQIEWVGAIRQAQALAFSGIHVVSSQIFAKLHDDGVFSIIPTYLNLVAEREKIIAFRADESYWRDLGRPENVLEAARDLAGGKYSPMAC